MGCEGIMQGTPKAGDVRSEQLNAMGNPMQGVGGALRVTSLQCVYVCHILIMSEAQ